jgi:hypothetical protein
MSAEVRKTGRSFRYCLFFPCSFHPKITKMQVVPQIIGEAKKRDWHNSIFGGKGWSRVYLKQILYKRRCRFHKNLLETYCFVPSLEYLF